MGEVLTLETFARKKSGRKKGCNHNKNGSVRNINGKIYVDFIYLGERVRETSGLTWNGSNKKLVRKQLDRIIMAIDDGTFRFAKTFPHSNKKDEFTKLERKKFNEKPPPGEVKIGEYLWKWYELIQGSDRRTGRTLIGYRGYLKNYIDPYFGKMTFSDINAMVLERYTVWCKQRCYRGKAVCNKTVNKTLVPFKIMCRDAAIEFGWGSFFNPFYGFRKLPENDSNYEILPFSKAEQNQLIEVLPDHWKPYFRFAFCSGLRPGEQIAIQPGDIDWEKKILHIRRAMTLDKNGKLIEGRTKNSYSRRSIKLLPVMYNCLQEQKKIHDQFKCKYFFCSKNGSQVDLSHLRQRIWGQSLKRANLGTREMKQTRHSFATIALSCGENPLWIAKVMGHSTVDMIVKVYAKYVEDAVGDNDGRQFNNLQTGTGNNG